jgi:hypothetical protein
LKLLAVAVAEDLTLVAVAEEEATVTPQIFL